MSRIQETAVYTFDELDERAKERARDWYRRGNDDDNYWSESVIEDAARLGKMIGIDIETRPVKLMGGGTRYDPDVYWDLGNGGGVSVGGRYSYRKGGALMLSKEAPTGEGKGYEGNNTINRIARELQAIQRRAFYGLSASLEHGRHTNQTISVFDSRDNDVTDDAIGQQLAECLGDFAHWIYINLQSEYEYVNADEQVDESIRANDYEFTEDGERA